MLGIDAVDLVIILVLAVVMFGPEKLPEYSRKLARIFVYLRDIANNAKSTLRTELGPEYADLELRDLNPKTFIAKQLREEVALIDEAKRELKEAQDLLKGSARDAQQMIDDAKHEAGARTPHEPGLDQGTAVPELALAATTPFDPEAT